MCRASRISQRPRTDQDNGPWQFNILTDSRDLFHRSPTSPSFFCRFIQASTILGNKRNMRRKDKTASTQSKTRHAESPLHSDTLWPFQVNSSSPRALWRNPEQTRFLYKYKKRRRRLLPRLPCTNAKLRPTQCNTTQHTESLRNHRRLDKQTFC